VIFDGKRAVPVVRIDFFNAAGRAGNSGIVYERIEAAQPSDRIIE
jgi:hypothetical protein